MLELAAGTGRLAVPLALAGHQVTAVDIDPAMLDRGRSHAAATGVPPDRLAFVEADLRRAASCPTPVATPSRSSRSTRSCCWPAATPSEPRSGRSPRTSLRAAWPPSTRGCPTPTTSPASTAGHARVAADGPRDAARVVTKAGSAQHDAATNTVNLHAIYEEGRQGEAPRRWVRHDRLRLVSADELAAFAEDAGLRVEILAGGYDLSPIGPGSERVVLVAERR